MGMLAPSTRQFRLIVTAALLAWTIPVIIPTVGLLSFSEDVTNARTWNYLDARLPFRAIQAWWVVNAIATVVGLVGLLHFWPPARWILAGALVAALLIQPLIGLLVLSPFEQIFAGCYNAASVWILTVSFWSELAGNFDRDQRENGI